MKSLLFLFSWCALASQNPVYIAQSSAGSNNGTSCANAYAVTFFNTSGNWGSGANQIGPGTTIDLCGTITTELTAYGSGTSSSPITISFQSTAQISLPACDNNNGCLNIDGLSYVIVDGGTPCGPGTACAMNLIGTGIIQQTANGSGLTYQQDSVSIYANNHGCHNCEIRNLIIGPVYQHTSSSDTHNFGVSGAINLAGCNGCATKVHDLTVYNAPAGVNYTPASSGDNGLQIYNNYIYSTNGGINLAAASSSETLSGATVHDNYLGSTVNWDATGCPYHHDGIHAWGEFGGGISGVQFYNNAIIGNYGGCPTGAVFFEGYTHDSNFYNNLFLLTYSTLSNGIVDLTGFNMAFYNNVITGDYQTGISDICFGIGYDSDSSFPYTPSISFENNAIQNCGTLIDIQTSPTTLTAWDYNGYGEMPAGGTLVYNGKWYSALASWQAVCACDLHSVLPSGGATGSLNLNASGVPQSGSPVINAGIDLTSLGITALDSSTSAGNIAQPSARPFTGAWTVGAYNFVSPPTGSAAGANVTFGAGIH